MGQSATVAADHSSALHIILSRAVVQESILRPVCRKYNLFYNTVTR